METTLPTNGPLRVNVYNKILSDASPSLMMSFIAELTEPKKNSIVPPNLLWPVTVVIPSFTFEVVALIKIIK